MNHWNMQEAERINLAISQLPKAELVELVSPKYMEKLNNHFGVRVRDSLGRIDYAQVCGKEYVKGFVQHEEAFRPIIEALTVAGNKNFKFSLTYSFDTARLWIFTGSEVFDTVSAGFNIQNSFHGHSRLQYGLTLNQYDRYIEIVGYRQVCSNGMKIRVPLEQAEIIKPELVQSLKEKIADYTVKMKHTGGVFAKIEAVKYMAEAVELLREPLEAMIKAGKKITIGDKEALTKLVKKHVGKRFQSKVLEQYNKEEADLWGLYNAITYVASHDETLKDSARETLVNKAANMLLAEIRA